MSMTVRIKPFSHCCVQAQSRKQSILDLSDDSLGVGSCRTVPASSSSQHCWKRSESKSPVDSSVDVQMKTSHSIVHRTVERRRRNGTCTTEFVQKCQLSFIAEERRINHRSFSRNEMVRRMSVELTEHRSSAGFVNPEKERFAS